MATQVFQPIYRMTVFAPGSDTIVFTPDASAPHSDEFKVATSVDVAGFQPYMGIPHGRKERFDPIKRKLDIGSLTINLLDIRTTVGGSNFQRWVTAMIGDDKGKPRVLGLLAAVEESTDGSTFLPFYVGRIRGFELDGLLQFKITIKTDNDIQKIIDVFEGEPSASLFDRDNGGYANRRQLCPLGPDINYGPVRGLGKPIGKWRTAKSSRNRAIEVFKDSDYNAVPGRIYVSKPLLEKLEIDSKDAWKRETEGAGREAGVIARITQGGTVGRFRVTYLKVFIRNFSIAIVQPPASIHSFLLEEIDSGGFEHASLSAFAIDSTVSWQFLFEGEPTEKVPMLLDNVHPVQLWKDCLLGKFSTLEDGVAKYSGTIEIDVGAFDTLLADGKFKNSRWIINESQEMSEFIEDNITGPYNLGYRMAPTASNGRFYSMVSPFDMSLPTTLAGIPTIATDDLKVGPLPTWEPGKQFVQVQTKYYFEQLTTIQNLIGNNSEENVSIEGPENPTLIREFEVPNGGFIHSDIDNVNSKAGDLVYDARGIRFFMSEFYFDLEFQNGFELLFSRRRVMERQVRRMTLEAAFRWQSGPATVTLEARRTGSTNDLQIGDYRLVDVDFLPDPFSHTRGTARLMQCTERSEIPAGPTINFRMIDSGLNIQRATPTLGTFAQISATNTASGSVSVLQAGRVRTDFAVTAQSVSVRPDSTSSLWLLADDRNFSVSSSQDIVIGELPENSRVWVRAQVRSRVEQDLDLPSDYGFASSFDISTTITAPTNLSVFNLTVSGASATWTIGEDDMDVEVRMKTDAEASLTHFASLGQGANFIQFAGRSVAGADNPHTIGVRHINNQTGAVSAEITKTYNIENIVAQIQAPPIGNIIVLNPRVGMY